MLEESEEEYDDEESEYSSDGIINSWILIHLRFL